MVIEANANVGLVMVFDIYSLYFIKWHCFNLAQNAPFHFSFGIDLYLNFYPILAAIYRRA